MKIAISIVSHGNFDDLVLNHSHYESKSIDIYIHDNLKQDSVRDFCKSKGYIYSSSLKQEGYGANNNHNFIKSQRLDYDYFLVINPDAKIIEKDLLKLAEKHMSNENGLIGLKVVESGNFKKVSHRRKFPALFDPLVSLVLKQKRFLRNPEVSSYTDWVGGSFMLFKYNCYQKVHGFDPLFFMYYEDIDICRRCWGSGIKVYYDSSFSFYHEAQRGGHKLFSRAFFWNLQSMLKYFLKYPTVKLLSNNEY